MTSPVVITRLNAKTVSFGGGRGGGRVLTAEDVAHAMGVRHNGDRPARIEWAVAMLKYAGQDEYRCEVLQWLTAVAIRLSDDWRRCSFEQKQALAQIALNECIPNSRCPVCHGRETVPDDGGIPMACPCCSGRGWIRHTGAAKASALGIDESSYYRTWAQREAALVQRIDEVDAIVVGRIGRLEAEHSGDGPAQLT